MDIFTIFATFKPTVWVIKYIRIVAQPSYYSFPEFFFFPN